MTTETLKREPLDAKIVGVLDRTFSPMEKMVCGFNPKEIDISFGCGVLDGSSKCVWNKKGIRFTVWMASDGGHVMSADREPDPYYLESKNAAPSK